MDRPSVDDPDWIPVAAQRPPEDLLVYILANGVVGEGKMVYGRWWNKTSADWPVTHWRLIVQDSAEEK